MVNRRAFHSPFWLLISAAVCAAGMWTYTERVLIPYQQADAARNGRPRGNLSDLYPRWLGARELLLHGRDPYSPAVTREIQAGYYGRPIDLSRSNDPRDEQGFAYPVYVVFLLAPTIHLPFAVVQKGFLWMLVFLTAAGVLLWLRVLRWSSPLWIQFSLLALTFGSLGVMQALKLQQMSLLVAGILALAVTLLVADRLVASGILLAFASIKPQLLVLLLVWLFIWTLGNWRSRYSLTVSYISAMVVLIAASEWYLPHWIPKFWHAAREYQRYTAGMSVMSSLIGRPWSWALEFLALCVVIAACWRERRQPANSNAFAFMISLVLASTVLFVPTLAPYNQVLLIPGVLALVQNRREIWRSGIAHRALLVGTAGMIIWPWISTTTLAVLSFLLPQQSVEPAWAIPIWSQTEIPVLVAAMLLVLYYQTSFTPPPRPVTS